MKLIMSGGGESDHFVDLDSHFLSQLSDQPTLLFIPIASEPEDYDYEYERIIEVFSTIEFDSIDMLADLNDLDWDYLRNFDAVYLDGGNTFRLMDQIRKSHFYELIRKFLFHGGVVNGDSAGAIILGSHLETAHFGDEPDENYSNVICYQGLNLLGDWAIHCHYESHEDREIREFVDEYGFPVIALREDAGISVIDRKLQVVGNAPVRLFGINNEVALKPKDVFLLPDLWPIG